MRKYICLGVCFVVFGLMSTWAGSNPLDEAGRDLSAFAKKGQLHMVEATETLVAQVECGDFLPEGNESGEGGYGIVLEDCLGKESSVLFLQALAEQGWAQSKRTAVLKLVVNYSD